MAEPFLGQIILFGGNFAPQGWALCQGQLLSIPEYTALFSILGTTYGGNGTTNFALPDLRGRVPIAFGQGAGLQNYNLGEMIGSETVALTTNQIPSHSHSVNANKAHGNAASPADAYLAETVVGDGTEGKTYSSTLSAPAKLNSGSVQPTGGSQPHNNIQPVLGLNYIIALQGIYPSRG